MFFLLRKYLLIIGKKIVEKLSKQNKWPTPVSVLLCQVLHLEAQNTQIYIVFNRILFDTSSGIVSKPCSTMYTILYKQLIN